MKHMNAIEKLLSISSVELAELSSHKSYQENFSSFGSLSNELFQLLQMKNGFYAFKSALQVFPHTLDSQVLNLEMWNNEETWRYEYKGMSDQCFFFAMDIFGDQFCIHKNKIWTFISESGALEYLAEDLGQWAKIILDDYEFLTGYPLADEWQELNGPLKPGERLLPKMLFIWDGEYEVNNLYSIDAVKGMRFKGDIANQMKKYPTGSRVKIVVKPPSN